MYWCIMKYIAQDDGFLTFVTQINCQKEISPLHIFQFEPAWTIIWLAVFEMIAVGFCWFEWVDETLVFKTQVLQIRVLKGVVNKALCEF